MTEPENSKVSQDRGFKNLFETYPLETIAFFAPEIIEARGKPVSIKVLVQNEIPLVDLRWPSRFLDIALVATFADGSTIVLVEHWSDAHQVDHPRVILYAISLKIRHPEATVLPVIFVTDPKAEVTGHWSMKVLDREVLSLDAKVVRITPADLVHLHAQAIRSRVAAALLTLAYGPGITSAVRASVAFAKAPGTIDDLKRLLPFIEDLAKLTPADKVEYKRRLIQEPTMSIIEEWIAETKAEGVAQGKLDAILHMVSKGRATIDGARAEIADLVAAGTITREQAEAAVAKLG
jgi:hypothetical protein